jgi:uracil-DNA glycosylase
MPDESAGDTARRIAASLKAAAESEAAFGLDDALLPERERPTAQWDDAAPAGGCGDLAALEEIVSRCTNCHLHETRTQTVFGAGNPNAEVMIVGEAPGAEEDRQGVPFVGRSGQLLTKMLAAIDLPREDVFICNTLKCRPPGNKTPGPQEIAACLPYLTLQIEMIAPRIILPLGGPAAKTVLDTKEGITKLRGRIIPRHGARCVPSFHPAYLLRNPNAKREAWADLQLVRRLLDE